MVEQVAKTILVVGSGPIRIGQGCEFDYSGTQACRALRDEGHRTVLVNPNPATIMTAPGVADVTYIEPLMARYIEPILEKEGINAILATVGGQDALNLLVDLDDRGVLLRMGIEPLGVKPNTVHLTENREAFANLVASVGFRTPKANVCWNAGDLLTLAATLTFPVVVRTSFNLGGRGGQFVRDLSHLHESLEAISVAAAGESFVVEQSLRGWKEYELEVMRDRVGNFVVVCCVENVNPMGVHTGDSITVAPPMTLTDREYQRLRNMAKAIFEAAGMETGGANIQFAVDPANSEVVVIELNPRVSRSSALVSKATGYPIAELSARTAVGRLLSDIPNHVTGQTIAAFEPSIDYVAVKIPKWDFHKFPDADPRLGIAMKAVGEVLAFGVTFPSALVKAIRSLDPQRSFWDSLPLKLSDDELARRLEEPTASCLEDLMAAVVRGWSIERLHRLTSISRWFLHALLEIWDVAANLTQPYCTDTYLKAKEMGFSDDDVGGFWNVPPRDVREWRWANKRSPGFRMVDSCAGEFSAMTPFYYSAWGVHDELKPRQREGVLVLGSGPNRIGQGVEFDHCCVQALQSLQACGFDGMMINCNPETVSTDHVVADRLFFEPLDADAVLEVIAREKPRGVFAQFGGQTALNLAKVLAEHDVVLLGHSWPIVAMCEERSATAKFVESCNLQTPPWITVDSHSNLAEVARQIRFPVLVRPSFVIGGTGMALVRSTEELVSAVQANLALHPSAQILVDSFLEGAVECDVELLCDGTRAQVVGILEQIEEAGIHSGDSYAVVPAYSLSAAACETIRLGCERLGGRLGGVGLLNIQVVWHAEQMWVIEINPRASRTIPFLSKALGVNLVSLAVRCALGASLGEVLPEGPPRLRDWAVKAPVFPFSRLLPARCVLGPAMLSLGESMGRSDTFAGAMVRAVHGAGFDPFAKRVEVIDFTRDEPLLDGEFVGILEGIRAGTVGAVARLGMVPVGWEGRMGEVERAAVLHGVVLTQSPRFLEAFLSAITGS